MRLHYLLLLLSLGILLSACEPAERPVPNSQIPTSNQVVATSLAGRYQWVFSIVIGSQGQEIHTPESRGFTETLLISETLFDVQRNGQSVLYFPYVTLIDEEADPSHFRIYDADWDQVRYRANLSGDQLVLSEQTSGGLRAHYQRLP